MAKFFIGLIVGIFLGAATSAYSAGVAVGWDQEPPAFLSGPLETQHLRHPALAETQHLRHPALAASRIAAVAVSREVRMSN